MEAPNVYETPSLKEWSAAGERKDELDCSHCRGYLGDDDYCIDMFSDTGEVAVAVLRCMHCRKLLDPVILPHRFKTERVAA